MTVEDRELFTVRDYRSSTRAFPVLPNGNGADGTVAPDAPGGAIVEATVVLEGDSPAGAVPPPDAQRWAGWPATWATQQWNGGVGLAERVSTVFSCVRLNSGAIGSMTPVVSRGRDPLDLRNLPQWVTNPQPELYSDVGEAFEQIDASMEYTGDAYLLATSRDRITDQPRTWMVLDPTRVLPVLETGVRRVYVNGRDETDDVLHLRYRSMPGRADGLSPLEGARGNLASAAALEHYGAQLARMGGIPWGVLEMPGRLRNSQAEQVAQDFVQSRRALDGRPAVVSGGAVLKTLTINPKDMALLDLRVFDEQRIAAAFGVHPYLVGLPQPSGLTYANASTLRDDHYRSTLRITAGKMGRGLSEWALPADLSLTLNASEYVQGTVAERVDTYLPLLTALDQDGQPVLTGEELRTLIGLPPRAATGDAINRQTTGTL